MVVRRKKKYRKYLGTRYARRGYNDRNRGAGNRGGRGKCGWKFKKHKFLKILKEHPELFEDKKGFTPPTQREIRTINLEEIMTKFDAWLEQGIIKQEGDYYVLDLRQLGYNKLLGKGCVDKKMKIIVDLASESAIEKVKEAGGEVITLFK